MQQNEQCKGEREWNSEYEWIAIGSYIICTNVLWLAGLNSFVCVQQVTFMNENYWSVLLFGGTSVKNKY